MLKRNRKTQPARKKDGQSTVEYIILVAAVLAVVIIFLAPNGIFYGAFDRTLNTGTTGMEEMANRLSTSRP